MDVDYSWTKFYMEFADKLLEYKNNRKELLEIIKHFYYKDNLKFTKLTNEEKILPPDIDPFTVSGFFNRSENDENRKNIMNEFKKEFKINASVPESLGGIPTLRSNNVSFSNYKEKVKSDEIDNLWNLFEIAIIYSKNNNEKNKENFIIEFDKCMNQKQTGLRYLTSALFRMRPYTYISLDDNIRNYLSDENNSNKEIQNMLTSNYESGQYYLDLCEELSLFIEKNNDINNFIDISSLAYRNRYLDENVSWWAFSPGENAKMWDFNKEYDVMSLGWCKLGDLRDYKDKSSMKESLEKHYDRKNVSSLYYFSNEIKIGDVIIARNGLNKIIGYGIVKSDYIYNKNLMEVHPHLREVEWIEKDLNIKTNKQFSRVTITKLKNDKIQQIKEELGITDMNVKVEEHMKDKYKRNMIYFGAPGTGKSHTLEEDRKRLLSENENNYERVTFHPDYSYSNFVGTYKPVSKEDGSIEYKYVPGPFMRILVKALKNPSENYLLIIEEINRANTAAVFGDIFQLLDRKDNKSKFPINTSEDIRKYLAKELEGDVEDYAEIIIPENMYIWASMNSADQGVFAMDTAFKRRWNFKYFGIDDEKSVNKIKDIYVKLNGKIINWNKLRSAINNYLLSKKVNEDKLLGPFFIFEDEKYRENKEIDEEEFKEMFTNKVLMYLYEDAIKSKRKKLFSGIYGDDEKEGNILFSKVCEEFKDKDVEIFCEEIKNKFSENDGE